MRTKLQSAARLQAQQAERLHVAELFADSALHRSMTNDESAAFPLWLLCAPIADVRMVRAQLEKEAQAIHPE